MDFGGVGFDGFVGSLNSNEAKQEWFRSGYLKQQGSDTNNSDQDELHKSSKLAKTESVVKSNANGLQQQQMLSFSSSKSDSLSSQNAAALPGFVITSSGYHRGSGYNYGSYNSGNMHGFFTEAKGPFTPSQWMELEHQALIYKHITANVPIPANLLIPIKRALDSAGFSSFSGGLFRPSTLPWGAFHLGYSSSNDPEPGRCRRTDGKKWRCSRDAVADQKYCERHMNRGRHRSRKHVEGQSGHSAAAAATVATTTKLMPSACSSSVSAAAVGLHGSGAPNGVTVAQHQQQLQNLQSDSSFNLSSAAPLSRMFLSKEDSCERMQDSSNMTMLSSNKIDLKSKDDPFFISKQQNSYQESPQIEFGHVNSDSLVNPSHNSSSFISCGNYNSSQTITDQETLSQHSIHQFVNGWPKSQSDHSTLSWPRLDLQSDRTQLSISIPMAPLDYKSSTSSPNEGKSIISPLSLSRDMDSAKMEMGVKEHKQRQANWIPVSWEASIAGPLGEVLHNSNNSGSECKNSSAFNLLVERWDGSPQLGSSPTGILQKTAFGSLSNSSAGSSPRAENNRTSEGASLCSDLPGSSLIHSSSLPAL